jgi:hypothetical protein
MQCPAQPPRVGIGLQFGEPGLIHRRTGVSHVVELAGGDSGNEQILANAMGKGSRRVDKSRFKSLGMLSSAVTTLARAATALAPHSSATNSMQRASISVPRVTSLCPIEHKA